MITTILVLVLEMIDITTISAIVTSVIAETEIVPLVTAASNIRYTFSLLFHFTNKASLIFHRLECLQSILVTTRCYANSHE